MQRQALDLAGRVVDFIPSLNVPVPERLPPGGPGSGFEKWLAVLEAIAVVLEDWL
jgi:hypothetical protein